ncbi:MAG: DUF4279 domain-containing protein [Oscillospiraceae bacterium]|nr:DUF4279 domain-containing protein [Oscillospiraceae bacterium]
MTQTKCYTYFRITGDFDPDAVTELLGLQPEKSWRIGDKRKGGGEYTFATWNFGYCEVYDSIVDEQMRKTIAPLLPKVALLQEIRRKFDVNFYLEVVPVLAAEEEMPCLAPSLDVMRFCCDTQTEMDIDLTIESY